MKAALIAILDVNNLPRYVRSLLALGLVAVFSFAALSGREDAVMALGPLAGAAVAFYFVPSENGP